MAKLIKLTEKDLRRVVDRVIEEQRMGSVAVGMDSGFVKETEGKPEKKTKSIGEYIDKAPTGVLIGIIIAAVAIADSTSSN